MNTELTEREQKLLDYTLFLLHQLNHYVVLIAALYKNLQWLESSLRTIPNREDKEVEFIEFLRSEYDINLTLTPDTQQIKRELINGSQN